MLAVFVMPRTYDQPHRKRIAGSGHLPHMADSGYLTEVRDARLPRRRPSARCDPACGGCSRRGGERYASSVPAALRSRDRSDHALRRRGSHAHDRTAGPAPARLHPAVTTAPVPALRGTRGRRTRYHRAKGSALPCSGINVAPGIAAATSRPSRNGTARSSRRCTTSTGRRTMGSCARTSRR